MSGTDEGSANCPKTSHMARDDPAEIDRIELDIHLRGDPARYGVGTADIWVLDHLLRFIPGNGRR
jgi:hypothetical protein